LVVEKTSRTDYLVDGEENGRRCEYLLKK